MDKLLMDLREFVKSVYAFRPSRTIHERELVFNTTDYYAMEDLLTRIDNELTEGKA